MKRNLPVTHNEKTLEDGVHIISCTDLKGAITSFNKSFEDISGFSSEELIQKNHNVVRHPDMPAAAFEDLWKTLQAGKQWMGIVKNRCKNGDYYWVSAHVSPFFENGQIAGYESVRVKPLPEYVERATKLYARLNKGKQPFSLLERLIGKFRVFLPAFSISVLMVLITSLLTNASLMIMLAAILGAIPVSSGFVYINHTIAKKDRLSADQVFNNSIAQWIYTGRFDTVGAYRLAVLMQKAMLRTSISSIKKCSQELGRLSGNVTAIVELTNSWIHRQHDEISMVATAMNQMTATVHEVAQNTNVAMTSANSAKSLSSAGAVQVTNAIGVICSLSSKVNEAKDTINALANDSKNIGKVLDIIAGVAEQTNLLALNAAIEAARAGEQGRGFAVVADEVRSLASRTQQSTREIQDMVGHIQNDAGKAVKTMLEVDKKSTEAVEQVEASAESLAEIAGSISVINDMNTQIATAVEEQAAVSEEINRNIINISDISSGTEKSANSTLNDIKELNAVIRELESTVNRFSDV